MKNPDQTLRVSDTTGALVSNSARAPAPASKVAQALYFEDFHEAESCNFGSRTVTAEEIEVFAAEFDPQPRHTGSAAATTESLAAGPAASNWHICAMLMRMICDGFLCRTKGLGSPGVDECRWHCAVHPGDILTARYTVKEKRVTRSRPGVGLCRFYFELVNQHGEVAMTWNCPIFIVLRNPAEAT